MYVKLGLTLWEEHRYMMLENMVLGGTFGPKRDEVIRGGEKLIYIVHQTLLKWSNKGE
jgi:hypothetical protein